MHKWDEYIRDVKSGKIVACNSIKKAIERFERFKKRDDIYFDPQPVERCIAFIGTLKHFLGKSAGQPFILEPWQTFIVANIFGLKWKKNDLRVCREVYIQVARKSGKDCLAAALLLYLLIAEGEAAPEIVAAANSTDQAGIAFKYISKFAAQLDPSKKVLKQLRSSVQCLPNDGIISVISSDPSKMDGKNLSAFLVDEFHESKDRKMYDVLASSSGMRLQSLALILTTAGFHLSPAPCHTMYMLSLEILNGIKEMDNFFPFIWELDPDDDWKDPKNFIKCQPNLGVTVTEDFMLSEVKKAEADSTALVGVLTKTFNKWCQSKTIWIPQEIIAALMQPVNLEDYRGKSVIVGLDLGSVSDFSALTVLIPPDETTGDKYIFKTWCFFPENNLNGHPNEMLYRHFVDNNNEMILTRGNVQDYAYILQKVHEINQICPIAAIYLDRWNASQFQIDTTNAGYNVQEFSQSVGHFSASTKEAERIFKEGKAIIDRSSCVLWTFQNVYLRGDINGNVKPSKESASKKIDPVISMLTALGGYLENPIDNSLEIYVL